MQLTIHITATNNDNNNNHFSLTLPSLSLLCSCNSRASSPSTGSTVSVCDGRFSGWGKGEPGEAVFCSLLRI
jgi:hypothetical protein